MLYTSNNKEQSIWTTSGDTGGSWQHARAVIPSGTDKYQITFQGTRTRRLATGNVIAIDDIKACKGAKFPSADVRKTTAYQSTTDQTTTDQNTTDQTTTDQTTINQTTTDQTTTDQNTTDQNTTDQTTTDQNTTDQTTTDQTPTDQTTINQTFTDQNTTDQPTTDQTTINQTTTDQTITDQTTTDQHTSDQTTTDQTPTDQTTTDQNTPDQTTDQTTTDQTTTDQNTTDQNTPDQTTDQTTTDQTTTDQTTTDQSTTDQTPTDQTTINQTTTDQSTTAQTNATSQASYSPADCDFKNSLCGYERSPKSPFAFTWQRMTASESTIPARNDSYFLSVPVGRYGVETSIATPKMATGSRCLIFYYYISGKVTLEVSSDIDKKPAKVLWSHTGDSGSDWSMVQIVLDAALPPNSKNYKIVLTATKQYSALKDAALAVDDIQFLREDCSGINDMSNSTNNSSSSSTSMSLPMSSTALSHGDNHTTASTLQPSTPADKITSTIQPNKLIETSATAVKSTTTTRTTSTNSTKSNTDNNQQQQQQLITIVVPVTLVSVIILVLIVLLVVHKWRKIASLDLHGFHDESVTNTGRDNSTPAYINHTYSSDQGYGSTNLDRPLQ